MRSDVRPEEEPPVLGKAHFPELRKKGVRRPPPALPRTFKIPLN